MTDCKHTGPHKLLWFHTDGPLGKPIFQLVEQALPCAGAESACDNPGFEDIAAAEPTVVACLERARAQFDPDAYRGGFEVSDEELAAIRLVMEEAVEYMDINGYGEGDDEDAEAARALHHGSAWACLADAPGWFESVSKYSHHKTVS